MAGTGHFNPHYSGSRSHRGTLRKADLNLSVSHLKLASLILLVALVFVGRALNASPVPLAHAALAEIVIYDDAFQNGYSASDWAITPPANPAYSGDAFAGAFSLQKNLAITGGTGEFLAQQSVPRLPALVRRLPKRSPCVVQATRDRKDAALVARLIAGQAVNRSPPG